MARFTSRPQSKVNSSNKYNASALTHLTVTSVQYSEKETGFILF